MTRLEDRQTLVAAIVEACAAGTRLAPACSLAGIDLRTFQRWRAGGGSVRGGGGNSGVVRGVGLGWPSDLAVRVELRSSHP
jgi:hypothetical protein